MACALSLGWGDKETKACAPIWGAMGNGHPRGSVAVHAVPIIHFHCDYAFFPRWTGFARVYDQSHDNRLHAALPLFFARRADMQ